MVSIFNKLFHNFMGSNNALYAWNLLNLSKGVLDLSLDIVWPVLNYIEQSTFAKMSLDLRENIFDWHKIRGVRTIKHNWDA